MDGLLPPYTREERNRELRMRVRALCWRAKRICTKSQALQAKSTRLLQSCQQLTDSKALLLLERTEG